MVPKVALLALILVASVLTIAAEKARFDNYRLYQIPLDNLQQLEVLQAVEQLGDGYSFWAEPAHVNSRADLVVPPHKFAEFSELVDRYGLRADLKVSNLQQLFDYELRRTTKEAFGWNAYYTLEEIYAWMDGLVAQYPTVLTAIVGGSSYEGREIRGVKVSYKAGNPGVFMEGTIHAREWVSAATLTWILNELLTSSDESVRNIAENYDWYFFPVTNPDGYVFTHTSNRQWRKTRQPHSILCFGADPNRNWGYNFMQGGASSVPCSDTFAGPEAFSEPETKSLSEYFTSVQSSISTYLSFHSYSQLLLLPYGHTTEPLDNYAEMMEVGTKAIQKLQERYGTVYKIGNIAEAIYVASGGSIDWIKGVYQTPIVFAYELRDTGTYGFVLPPEQIIPNSEETLDSIIVILEEGKNRGIHSLVTLHTSTRIMVPKVALQALFLAASFLTISAEKARFDNYRLYQIQIDNLQQLEVLQAIEQLSDGYNFWAEPAHVNSRADLVVPPHKFAEFSELVDRYGFRADLKVSNLQQLFDDELRRTTKEAFGWNAYYTLEEIYAWMDGLVAQYPTVLTAIVSGSSYEGREIRGVKVSYKAGNPGVFMEGTIHAREWVSAATLTWILNELLTSSDESVRNIAENYDWYFFPVTNPDGYVFTHTSNRLWRKTRQPHSILCVGADPNRNWGYNFMQGGASNVPCSDTYAGPEAFSEPETKSLSEYFSSVQSSISTYLSFHSYSQLLLLPYGHTTEPLDNYAEMMEVGTKAIQKLQERYGTVYKIGNIAEAIYIASGGSIDWIKGIYQTPIVFTYELRDTGTYGFVLPPEQIIPNSEETLDSIIVILEEGKNRGIH
ncbi:uncharacterized protein LOC129720401 [Wyeomyia smithii]|uniref:uncharacterized protein LOC129720401 n=1 Tax=Wyeomyia smithii TaxID=174621 RepID=UPI00246815F6|nr:uncharacterized protein LOC129720401 [Wyeomyia smithii]